MSELISEVIVFVAIMFIVHRKDKAQQKETKRLHHQIDLIKGELTVLKASIRRIQNG